MAKLTANLERATRVTGDPQPREIDDMRLRAMPVQGDFDRTALTISAVIATAHPVARRDKRGGYLEVLDPAGLEPPEEPLPFLDSHNRTRAQATIGVVRNVRLEDGQVVADLRFSAADDVQPIVQRVEDGTLSKFSAGYGVRKWRESVENGVRTRTAVNWYLIEVSLVAIPADPSCKKRGKDMALDENEQTRADLVESIRSALALPDDWATRMNEAEGELTEAEIREAAKEELLKRKADAPKIRVHGSQDAPAQILARQADAVAYRMAGGELPEAAREFVGMSLRDLASDVLQRAGETTRGMSADELFQRAAVGTSDFPLLVSNAMGKVALDSYRAAESPLKSLARQRTLPNFKESTSIRLGEMGQLVNERSKLTRFQRLILTRLFGGKAPSRAALI